MQGKIREKITEDQLKGLLEQISEQSVCVIYMCVWKSNSTFFLLKVQKEMIVSITLVCGFCFCVYLVWIRPILVCDIHFCYCCCCCCYVSCCMLCTHTHTHTQAKPKVSFQRRRGAFDDDDDMGGGFGERSRKIKIRGFNARGGDSDSDSESESDSD